MHVPLMAYIPDELVLRRTKVPVEHDRKLDHTQIGSEMTARSGDDVDETLPNFPGQLRKRFQRERAHVVRALDLL